MYTYTWYQWIAFFFLYCFLGWVIESTYVSIRSRHFVNRGFLRLPMLPLYGSGAVMMLWVSLPFQTQIPLVFLSGMAGATILEYITGYLMERLFKMRYWDYSNNPFNLHGYICLGTSIAWGFLTILMTEFIHKPVSHIILQMSPSVILTLISVIGVLFITDTIISTKQALDLARVLETMTKLKTEFDEIHARISQLKEQTSQKVSELTTEQLQKASTVMDEAAIKISELKKDSQQKLATIKENRDELTQKFSEEISSLSQQMHSITEKRKELSAQFSYYRKSLLQGNPTSSSRQFGEALRELKDSLKSRLKKQK